MLAKWRFLFICLLCPTSFFVIFSLNGLSWCIQFPGLVCTNRENAPGLTVSSSESNIEQDARRLRDQIEKEELTTSTETVKRPHIIFVIVDDHGYNDIGYHGSTIKTPTLDKLAANGVKLENHYVTPVCSPTRAQFMTGKYAIRTDLQDLLRKCCSRGVPLDTPTIAEKLRDAGYATHLVGKWHLGHHKEEYLPNSRGFDTFFGAYLGHGDHYTHSMEHEGTDCLDLHDNAAPAKTYGGQYSTTIYTQKATDIINRHNQSQPVFLVLSYQAVHTPLEVPRHYEEQYMHMNVRSRRTYAGMVAAVDEGVANVTRALADRGMWDNTLLVFTSDNGAPVPSKAGSNYPLKGGKFTMWEGGIRVAAFVTGGKNLGLPEGQVSRELMDISDWFPTFLGLAGGNPGDVQGLDGVNQWKSLKYGIPSQRTVIFHGIISFKPPVRDIPLPHDSSFDSHLHAAIRVGEFKLVTGEKLSRNSWPAVDIVPYTKVKVAPSEKKNIFLFNITADPTEDHDLSESKPELVRQMLDLLLDFQRSRPSVSHHRESGHCDPRKHGNIWGPWL